MSVSQDVLDPESTYYVSGPMTGIPEYNYPYFDLVTKRLRYLGLDVRSPHENPPHPAGLKESAIWEYQMKQCMRVMNECDSIIMLRGWTRSRGARKELKFGLDRGWPVYFYLDPPGRPVNMTRLP